MNILTNLKVGLRLALAFGAIVLLSALMAAFAARVLDASSDELRALAERRLPNTVAAGKLAASVLQNGINTRNVLMLEERAKALAQIDVIQKTRKDRAEYLDFLDKNVKTPAARSQLEVVKTARAAYLPTEDTFLDLVSKEKLTEAKIFVIASMLPAQATYVAELQKFVDVQAKVAQDFAASASAHAERGKAWLAGALALAVILATLIAWLVTRSITRPLAQAVEVADAIAAGNLRNTVVVDRGDELGTLLRSLDAMQSSLAQLVRQIRGKAGELTVASSELATTAEQVSAATNNQSEAAASMAVSVEQMTVSVSHITDSAQIAADKTVQSTQLSNSGREVVEKAGTEMTGIADGIRRSADLVQVLQGQSKEISSIAEVIKNIAEQTNLLALNAAIEAARAGEEGRSFALVADAVRELAERTAKSTAEIAATIDKIQGSTDQVFMEMNASVERANAGLKLSQEAGQSITALSGSGEEVLVAVKEISLALKEQSQASNRIARHVESIAQMAQENSSAVEQTKDSARTLKDLSATLQSSVTRFTV